MRCEVAKRHDERRVGRERLLLAAAVQHGCRRRNGPRGRSARTSAFCRCPRCRRSVPPAAPPCLRSPTAHAARGERALTPHERSPGGCRQRGREPDGVEDGTARRPAARPPEKVPRGVRGALRRSTAGRPAPGHELHDQRVELRRHGAGGVRCPCARPRRGAVLGDDHAGIRTRERTASRAAQTASPRASTGHCGRQVGATMWPARRHIRAVPTSTYSEVIDTSPCAMAMPKSPSRAVPSLVRSTLPGLRSRCTIVCLCA